MEEQLTCTEWKISMGRNIQGSMEKDMEHLKLALYVVFLHSDYYKLCYLARHWTYFKLI